MGYPIWGICCSRGSSGVVCKGEISRGVCEEQYALVELFFLFFDES